MKYVINEIDVLGENVTGDWIGTNCDSPYGISFGEPSFGDFSFIGHDEFGSDGNSYSSIPADLRYAMDAYTGSGSGDCTGFTGGSANCNHEAGSATSTGNECYDYETVCEGDLN
jgi:hypothetical protein